MALKFTTAYEEAKVHGVKILVYGRSGMGKTMLCATAPKPIIASAEAGLLSLSHANQLRVFGTAVDVQVAVIETLQDLVEFHDLCQDPEFPFETVCIDSITEIGEKVLANALKQVSDPRQAYGELYEKMITTMKAFRDLKGRHVVFVAKQTPNKENSTPLNVPMMPGKTMGPAMPYLTDEVFHLDVTSVDGKMHRFLQTQPDANFDAKDRSGALDNIEEPNLTKLINKIVS